MPFSLKIFFLPALCLCLAACGEGGMKNRDKPVDKMENPAFTSISALKAKNPVSGSFTTEGYAVKIYTCPPCPKGASCKPCMRNNIVISENNFVLDAYILTNKEMILFTNEASPFKTGAKYRFAFKILDSQSTSEPLNDAELVSWEKLNTPGGEKLKGEKISEYSYYQELIKPSWSPPAWIFGPVWSFLYLLIIISFGKVFLSYFKKELPLATALPFIFNLVFNLAFTPIQFGLKNNYLAALDVLLVLLTLVWAMKKIYPYARWITYAQIPYLIWVSFATALQLTITWLNR